MHMVHLYPSSYRTLNFQNTTLSRPRLSFMLKENRQQYASNNFKKLTSHLTVAKNDPSLRGCSKRPEANFTLRILSTASSILVIGIFPDSTKCCKSAKNNWYRKGTITCRDSEVYLVCYMYSLEIVPQTVICYHINSCSDCRKNTLLVVRSMRIG